MNQITTNQLTKKRKKKGFTLIELIAVIAIIGILAAVLVPKVLGYMNDARESKKIAQARNIRMAYETMISKDSAVLTEGPADVTVEAVADEYEAKTNGIDWSKYVSVEAEDYSELDSDDTMDELKALTAGSTTGSTTTP